MAGVSGTSVLAVSAPPSTAKTPERSLEDQRSDPAHGDQNQRRSDYSAVVAFRNRKIRAYAGAKSPIDRHTAGANPTAVSSLEAFRTPASEYLITPVTGRRTKTLNIEAVPAAKAEWPLRIESLRPPGPSAGPTARRRERPRAGSFGRSRDRCAAAIHLPAVEGISRPACHHPAPCAVASGSSNFPGR